MRRNFTKTYLLVLVSGMLSFCLASAFTSPANKKGKLKITFINTANGKPVVLGDSIYTNPFGETYSVTKLRYYISNISLPGNAALDDADNYQLVDAARKLSFEIPVKEGKYKSLRFLLGVDSVRNCSGAQDGALDPMNDMFWTWNSGYVMFKLEGTSPASTSVNERIEHHVGGYRFGNNVATPIELTFEEIKIKDDEPGEIFIEMNLDKYWSATSNIKISEAPVCTLPGALAKKIASNFPSIFSIKNTR